MTIDGKSIRLDLYVQDDHHTVYNAEMQQMNNPTIRNELPKRSRYYQSMIDLNLLEKGISYPKLQESYVIFICTFDPFGENKSIYTFQNICHENHNLLLGDMTTKIFLNTKGDGLGISEDLKIFLNYVETKQASDVFTKQIDNAVERIKHNKEWRREYMKELLLRFDERMEGREEGEALFATLTQKLLENQKTEELLRATKDLAYRELLYKEYQIKA